MADKPELKRYKFTVFIRGAQPQHLYCAGENALPRTWKRATKLLTDYEPGGGSLFPDRIEMYEHVRVLSGRLAQWKKLSSLAYSEIPDAELEWKKRAQRHADSRRDAPQAEAKLNHTVASKPAIGLMPRWRHEELRMIDLTAAIARYRSIGQEPHQEWHDELNELIARCTTKCETCAQPLVLCPHFDEKSQRHQAWANEVNAADAEVE